VKQHALFQTISFDRFDAMPRERLTEFVRLQERANEKLIKEIQRLRQLQTETKEQFMMFEDRYIAMRNELFGKSSEKDKTQKTTKADEKAEEKLPKTRVQLPSERYPNVPVEEIVIGFDGAPNCKCCGTILTDSKMTEDSEYLTKIPARFVVIRQKRIKMRCEKCHGDVQTAPAPPRIQPGSSYSDEMIIDVAMSKFCDLVPVNRYATIAGRSGLADLPPQSLIDGTHRLADFLKPIYDKIRVEVLSSRVLHADETPHRMLEGDNKTHWYFWGFSSKNANFFEARDTRSGDVASDFLQNSACEFLMSDVYSGYKKATREANQNFPPGRVKIKNIYCNAHSRRKFKECCDRFPDEAQFYIDRYKEIYLLENHARGKTSDEVLRLRALMTPHFEAMKMRMMETITNYSSKSALVKATNYFLKNYDELTAFIKNTELPIDNNSQERLLRNPVIGRKTWYGTHSKRGAETTAVLFTIVESCKMNKVNPREFVARAIEDLHLGNTVSTPSEFLGK
jgi:transposase